MIAALWGRLQGWALTLAAALLVLAGAYAAGGRAARRNAELDKRRRDDESRKAAKAISNQVDRLGDDAVISEFDRLHDARRR